MARLYPPTISGPLTAFYADILTVPIIENKTVSSAEYDGYALVFRNSSTGNLIQMQDEVSYLLSEGKEPTFIIPSGKLVKGQYYKIQIAYYKMDGLKINIGYYSSIELIKYTAEPVLNFDKSQEAILHVNYSSTDITEKAYEYKFIIQDKNNQIVLDTDYQLHNRDSDKIEIIEGTKVLESFDDFEILTDLQESKAYEVFYECKTVNGLSISIKYEIYGITKAPNEAFDKGLVTISAKGDNEEGCIDIYLNMKGDYAGDRYILKRSKGNDIWKTIYTFTSSRGGLVYRDMTAEDGETYVYSLQSYNSHGVYSDMIYSNPISNRLEYTYLTDGKRQLKLIYNPKVSSFKNDILESKTDAIGSKYPYIFRNGIVKYKEFPISAMLSYSTDEYDLFTIKNFNDEQYRQITNANDSLEEPDEYKRELDFKLEALEWLSNGKPKLFRSPTEGCYLVRLLNVSLAPEDRLGRRLHTFSATAYEIGDTSYKSLLTNGIYKTDLDMTPYQVEKQMVVETDLQNLAGAGYRIYNEPLGIYITGANDNATISLINKDNPDEEIAVAIGRTHAYTLQPTDASIIGFSVGENSQGRIKYTYKDIRTSDFENILSIQKDLDCTVGYFSTDDEPIDIIQQLTETSDKVSYLPKDIFKIQLFRKISYYESRFTKKDFISYIDGAPIDIDDLDYYEANNLVNIKSIIIPDGVEAFITYKRIAITRA